MISEIRILISFELKRHVRRVCDTFWIWTRRILDGTGIILMIQTCRRTCRQIKIVAKLRRVLRCVGVSKSICETSDRALNWATRGRNFGPISDVRRLSGDWNRRRLDDWTNWSSCGTVELLSGRVLRNGTSKGSRKLLFFLYKNSKFEKKWTLTKLNFAKRLACGGAQGRSR